MAVPQKRIDQLTVKTASVATDLTKATFGIANYANMIPDPDGLGGNIPQSEELPLSVLLYRPQTFATQQTIIAPAAAGAGKWRYIDNQNFQGGALVTSQDFVIFRNCQFGNSVKFTTCNNLRFEDCYWSNVLNTLPALHLLTCTKVRMVNCEVQGADFEAVTIDGCTDVSVRDLIVDDATRLAPQWTYVVTRAKTAPLTGNWQAPNVAYSAVKIVSSAEVDCEHLRVSNCVRGGLMVRDSDHVSLYRPRVSNCGNDGTAPGYATETQQEGGIVVMDSRDVTMRDGFAKECKVFGITTIETVDSGLLNKLLVDNMVVEGHTGLTQQTGGDVRAGIEFNGGTFQTFSNNEIRNSGGTALHTNFWGAEGFRAINNWCHHSGRELVEVHADGISVGTGAAPVLAYNLCTDNPRTGIQVKSSHKDFYEKPIHDAQLVANVCITNGDPMPGGTDLGWGISVSSTTGVDAAGGTWPHRTMLLGNVLRDNKSGDMILSDLSADTQVIGVMISDVRCDNGQSVLIDSSRDTFIGGILHLNETATNGGLFFREDANDCRVYMTSLLGVDPIRESENDITAIAGTLDSTTNLRISTGKSVLVNQVFSTEGGAGIDIVLNSATATVITAPALGTFISGVTGIGTVQVGNGWTPEWTTENPASFGTGTAIWNAISLKGQWRVNLNASTGETPYSVAHVTGAWTDRVVL